MFNNQAIGFFDSGVGGISVLNEAVKLLPNENYVYYGDSLNAPYGVKTVDEIKRLAFNCINKLLEFNVKAIVIACNTATAIAIDEARLKYSNIPIIGIEPAIKPATHYALHNDGDIIVMATPATLSMDRVKRLIPTDMANRIKLLPMPGLVEFIENGDFDSDDLKNFLREKIDSINSTNIGSIVLGCTHYPFIKKTLQDVVGANIKINDGSFGTVSELKRQLIINDSLSLSNKKGSLIILNSSQDTKLITLSKNLIIK